MEHEQPTRICAQCRSRACTSCTRAGTANEPIVHRNLTPRTVLVKHDNTPIFTGFERSKIPSEISVASSGLPDGAPGDVRARGSAQGLAAADHRSDVYSLCACLSHAVPGPGPTSELSRAAEVVRARPERGTTQRGHAWHDLDAALSELLGESVPPPPAPPARFWTEDQVVRFRDRDYRIVARLGSGGVGTTFKVVEIDRSTREDLGTYVAKVAHDGTTGNGCYARTAWCDLTSDTRRCPRSSKWRGNGKRTSSSH